MNQELSDAQAGFRKGGAARDQIANICWIIKKAREFQKNIYFCFIDYARAFDSVDHNKLWEILKEMGIPDHLTCLLRNLYAGQEATVETGHGTTDWFQIGKGVYQSCILSTCLYKNKIMASGPTTSWQIDGETVDDFIFGAPKSLQMVIAAVKLRHSLEEKLWPT